MRNSFDEMINRTGTNSAKFDEMMAKYGNDVMCLSVADMDFQVPKPIVDEFKKVVEHGIFGYTIMPDNYEELVKNWMRQQYNCLVETDWILFSPRINMAANMIVETFTKPGDKIMVHTPAYPALSNAILKYDREMVELPLVFHNNKWVMDFEMMENQISPSVKMIILCNPHNPTGRVWDKQELVRLANFCKAHDLLIVSDDIHGDIVRSDIKYTPILNVDPALQERTIILQSITKTFNIPGLILSNIIIPNPVLREELKETIDRWGLHNPNIFAAAVLEPAYTQCNEWLQEVNAYIWDNHEFMVAYFKKHMPLFEAYVPESTFLSWVCYKKTNCTEKEIENLFLKEAKVSIYMGSHFGEKWEGYIRINVATSRKYLEQALERIKATYEKILLF